MSERVVIDLPSELLSEAEQSAASDGTTLNDFLTRALHREVELRRASTASQLPICSESLKSRTTTTPQMIRDIEEEEDIEYMKKWGRQDRP